MSASASTSAPAVPSSPSTSRHRRRYVSTWLTGYGTSLVGDEIFYVALTWLAVQITTPRNVGLILVAGAVPRAIVLMVGGAVVDRWGAKRVILASDALRTLVMVAAALLVTSGPVVPATVAVLALVFGLVDGFFLPAVGAVPPMISSPESAPRVQALKTVVYRLAPFLGAPLASWVLITHHAGGAFWANAVLFGVSVLALALTRMRRPAADAAPTTDAPSSIFGDIADGWRLLLRDRRLLLVVVVVGLLDLGLVGPLTAGVPLLAAERGWGPAGIGWLLGGFGAGSALTAAVLAVRHPRARAGLVISIGATVIAVALMAIGTLELLDPPRAFALVGAGVGGLLAGVGAGLFGTLVNATMVALTPVARLGRVMAAVYFASYVSDPVSLSLTGVLAGAAGASVPFLLGGVMIAVAALLCWVMPHVRRVELPGPEHAA